MFSLREMQVKQEQYKDIMRRAEQRRLVKNTQVSHAKKASNTKIIRKSAASSHVQGHKILTQLTSE